MGNPFDAGFIQSGELKTLGFKAVGDNVMIARDASIIGLPNISLGNNVRIDSFANLIAHTGFIEIGDYVHICGGCYLAGIGGIRLHDFSGLSHGVKIHSGSDDYTGNHLTNPCVPKEYTRIKQGLVELGRHVIVGSGSVIMPRVVIGEGSAVGALSFVNRSLKPWGIYSGTPVRMIRERSKRLLEVEQKLYADR